MLQLGGHKSHSIRKADNHCPTLSLSQASRTRVTFSFPFSWAENCRARPGIDVWSQLSLVYSLSRSPGSIFQFLPTFQPSPHTLCASTSTYMDAVEVGSCSVWLMGYTCKCCKHRAHKRTRLRRCQSWPSATFGTRSLVFHCSVSLANQPMSGWELAYFHFTPRNAGTIGVRYCV